MSTASSSSSKRSGALGVAQGQLVGRVVKPDGHPEALGQYRQLRADIAVADDPETPAPHLVAPLGRFVPDTLVHLAGLVGQPPLHRDYLGYYELDDTAGI